MYSLIFHISLSVTLSLPHDLSAGLRSSAVPVPEEVKHTSVLLVLIDLSASWVGPRCRAVRGERGVIPLWGIVIVITAVLVSLLKHCGQRLKDLWYGLEKKKTNISRSIVCCCLKELYTMIRTQPQTPHCPPPGFRSATLTSFFLTDVYEYIKIISSVESIIVPLELEAAREREKYCNES